MSLWKDNEEQDQIVQNIVNLMLQWNISLKKVDEIYHQTVSKPAYNPIDSMREHGLL